MAAGSAVGRNVGVDPRSVADAVFVEEAVQRRAHDLARRSVVARGDVGPVRRGVGVDGADADVFRSGLRLACP